MRPHVVLVGAGHAHAIVLERWARAGPADTRLTVVTDRSELHYSGMVPGLVVGEYRPEEAIIDAATLARRAGARFVTGRVTHVDATRRRLTLGDETSIEYDLASLDVGSTVRGLDVPGAREHTIPVGRPQRLADRARRLAPATAVVVGGGAGGVELAAALCERLRRASDGGQQAPGSRGDGRSRGDRRSRARNREGRCGVTVVERASRLMSGYAETVSGRVRRALARRGIDVRLEASVVRVDAEGVELDSGERLPSDLTVWATGAAAHAFLGRSGLPVDEEGFVEVDVTLRVRGRESLFAAGDCASVLGRDVAKAGVHAVRQGPVLYGNLVATLEGRPLDRYEPQSDFLTLLNLGDGTALGTKWGLSVQGRWVRFVKDRIDRRFVERFR